MRRLTRRVVITGAGVVSPIGVGLEAYWRGLAEARSGIAPIGSFNAATFPTRIAAEVKELDRPAVALPPRFEAALRRDPKALFGIVAAREACAQAWPSGAPAPCPPERFGCSIATGLEIFSLADLVRHMDGKELRGNSLFEAAKHAALHSTLQVPADLGAQVMAQEAGAQGPMFVNVSACAAGTQALGEAFWAIREGVADLMLTGGYDSMINPLGVGGFCLLQAMSRRNDLGPAACRPFDAQRDGFVLGEGAALFVFEELDHALARGATILGEVLGYGTTLDAYRVTDPEPTGRGAEGAMRGALAVAGLEPEAIDYINAHGTGTPKNDAVETLAIHRVFGRVAPGVPVSSTKSQIGHLIGAAGAVEFAACLFALEKQTLPATLHLDHPDPACDLDAVPHRPRPHRVRRVLSNSFGFGGQNACIALGRVSEGQNSDGGSDP